MPLPVISVAQMREWETATWAAGQSEAEVIRLVGKRVAQAALAMTRPGQTILILAGNGHNGEDARCAREHLLERRVDLLDVTDPAGDRVKLEALLSLRPALVVDGLFGIGLNRPLGADWVRFIETVNQARRPVLAVDVPSGLDSDTGSTRGAAIRATTTLTVGAPKTGLLKPAAWPFVGRLEIAENVGLISAPPGSDLLWTVPADFAEFPPVREVATHKGTYGHVAIVAGSLGFHGAAVLAARGAQRAQPGLVTVYAHRPAYGPVASQLQAAMVSPYDICPEFRTRHDAVLIGPGLAAPDLPDTVKRFAQELWRESPGPVVVDASALDWLAEAAGAAVRGARVITPHPGEASRLLNRPIDEVQQDRPQAARELGRKFGNAWVVLKGHQTLVGKADGQVFVNGSGNPHLAQGGSGDLLAGYLTGLLARSGLEPGLTLRYAVWQHGAAADRLQQAQPNSWIIEDLAASLGSVG